MAFSMEGEAHISRLQFNAAAYADWLKAMLIPGRRMPMSELVEKELPPLSREDVGSLPKAEKQLQWNSAEKFVAHRNMHHIFPRDVIESGDAVRVLERMPDISVRYVHHGVQEDIDSYFSRTRATGLLVLKNGKIALERYEHGNNPSTRWASRSMGKSFASTIVGVAVQDGYIKSIDDSVCDYIDELKGSYYENVTIRHLMQMVTGGQYVEDHDDPTSDVYRLQGCTFGGRKGAFLELISEIANRPPRFGTPPGTVWNYSSMDSVLCGLVAERASGIRPAAYLSQRIWRPYGMEADGFWNTEADGGTTFTGSGIGATLRDYGRFGQFILEGGKIGERQVLPSWWIDEAAKPTKASLAIHKPYGFQWWLHSAEGVNTTLALDAATTVEEPVAMRGGDSMFYALGNSGQMIAINRDENVVIVKWAAWDETTSSKRANEDMALYAAIVDKLS